ncbi:MAG: hypothetical protein E2P00_06515 [Acidobacteria bacterium]|nr:MAG: hypothetical protein E2P00_06515 [Acidobacteriota bacterium]
MASRRISLLTMVLVPAMFAATTAGEVAMEALTTEHFRLHLAMSRSDQGRQTVLDLEALWRQYLATVGGMVPPHSPRRRLEVFAYEGSEGLRALRRDMPDLVTGESPFPGLLALPDQLLVAVDGAGLLARSDVAVLFHGVSHLMHDAVLYDEGVNGSWWVREGIATYLMQTVYRKDRSFSVGRVRSSEGYITDVSPAGRVAATISFAEEPKKSLDALRDAYSKGQHVPLATLLDHAADEPWPDPVQRDRAAVESWVLIHFLLHGPEASLRPRLARFLALERKGEGGSEAFRRVVSGELERLQPMVFRYTRKMR